MSSSPLFLHFIILYVSFNVFIQNENIKEVQDKRGPKNLSGNAFIQKEKYEVKTHKKGLSLNDENQRRKQHSVYYVSKLECPFTSFRKITPTRILKNGKRKVHTGATLTLQRRISLTFYRLHTMNACFSSSASRRRIAVLPYPFCLSNNKNSNDHEQSN